MPHTVGDSRYFNFRSKFQFPPFHRDTPHHLKNKRVQGGIDKAAANILLANALRQIDPERVIEEPHANEPHAEQSHQNGKLPLHF